MTESCLRREINDIFDRNSNNPFLILFNKLRRPPDSPGNISYATPIRSIVTDSLIGLIHEGKKQAVSLMGIPGAGKTSVAASVDKAVTLVCDRFGLTPPLHLPWEDSQDRAKIVGLISPELTSGPRNTPGHYGDNEYRIGNVHNTYLGYLGLKHWDYLIIDAAQENDRGQKLNEELYNPDGPFQRLGIQTNELYVIANSYNAPEVVDFREGVRQNPELALEGFESVDGLHEGFKVHGGGMHPTIEYLLTDSSRLYKIASDGNFDASSLGLRLFSPLMFFCSYDAYKKFALQILLPNRYSIIHPDRYGVVINRALRKRNGERQLVPPGSPSLDKHNLIEALKRKWNGGL